MLDSAIVDYLAEQGYARVPGHEQPVYEKYDPTEQISIADVTIADDCYVVTFERVDEDDYVQHSIMKDTVHSVSGFIDELNKAFELE